MRFLPRSLFGRIALLLIAGLVVAQGAGTAIHWQERQRVLGQTLSREIGQQIAAVYRAVQAQPVSQRAELVHLLITPRFALSLQDHSVPDHSPGPGVPVPQQGLVAELRKALATYDPVVPVQVAAWPQPPLLAFDISLQFDDGQWLRVRGQAPEAIFAQAWHALINLGSMLLVVIVLVVVAARSTVRPLTQLAAAAHSLSADLNHPPLPETGPLEVREAISAFNTMQQRIRSGIEERERFLAAVSHDLKTPVTRLQLRAELLKDPQLSSDIRRDVNAMQQLINDALDFLRGRSVQEAIQPVDLVALVESIADDSAGKGEITLDLPDALRFQGRPKALQRAVQNLLENALKYAGNAHIALYENAGRVRLAVEDDGDGIEPEHLERVFEPFYRIEGSRSRDTGGTGLGLAIVRQVARSHGGEAWFENREGGGLRAVLELPVIIPSQPMVKAGA